MSETGHNNKPRLCDERVEGDTPFSPLPTAQAPGDCPGGHTPGPFCPTAGPGGLLHSDHEIRSAWGVPVPACAEGLDP